MITGLAIESLAVRRGERRLFDGFGLDVAAGQVVALTGANGAGKTSLLRTVAGFIAPSAGRVRFYGAAGPLEADDARRGDVHLIGHQDGLKTARLAGSELMFQVQWTGGTQTNAREAAARLGLTPLLDLEVRKLSAGQRRRLALARLIASPRRLWLLDEPLAPLDARHRALFGEVMAEHLAGGGLILAAVHDPLPVAARVVEMA